MAVCPSGSPGWDRQPSQDIIPNQRQKIFRSFLYDLNNVFDIISQLFNLSSFDINNFPKKILTLVTIAFFASLLLDPEEIIKYPKVIKNEFENNKLVILPDTSKKLTRLFLKITYNKIFIIFFISSAIAFFSYSRTFIYFRF